MKFWKRKKKVNSRGRGGEWADKSVAICRWSRASLSFSLSFPYAVNKQTTSMAVAADFTARPRIAIQSNQSSDNRAASTCPINQSHWSSESIQQLREPFGVQTRLDLAPGMFQWAERIPSWFLKLTGKDRNSKFSLSSFTCRVEALTRFARLESVIEQRFE